MRQKAFVLIPLLLLISVIIVVGLILTGIIPFFKPPTITDKPTYDINNCENAKGSTSFGDYSVTNKILCYEERAYKLNDLGACFKLYNTGECVQRVSLNIGIYYCDKVEDKKQNDICNRDLMYDWSHTNKFHSLDGIERHRIDRQVSLKDGDTFLLNKVTINSSGITFFSSSRFTCSGLQEPFLDVNTVAGGPNNIYITDCSVKNGVGVIKYFKYDFSFLNYLPGI